MEKQHLYEKHKVTFHECENNVLVFFKLIVH